MRNNNKKVFSEHSTKSIIRINKALADLGICSRREADALIKSGNVFVNSKKISELGTKVSADDVITVNEKIFKLSKSPQKKLWIFYKPVGLITTHKDERNRQTVFDFLKSKIKERVISVGRLDLNSEGLLLITNDSDFAKYAESPKTGFERKYKVRVFGEIDEKMISELANGVTIDGIKYKPMLVNKLRESNGKNTWLECTLHEGKNREIRKLFEKFGLSVNRLIRFKYGPYELQNLKPGEVIRAEFLKRPSEDSSKSALRLRCH